MESAYNKKREKAGKQEGRKPTPGTLTPLTAKLKEWYNSPYFTLI